MMYILGVGMVQFGMKTEPNWTELFAKFKITELNCLHFELNLTVSNWTELFRTVIINTFEKNMKKTNEIEF